MVQREHYYAIVDEVDSILIDEARTPLIISGPAEGSTDKYYKIDRIIPKLTARRHHRGGQALRDRGHRRRRLHRRREGAGGVAHRAGDRALREAALGRQPLRSHPDGGAAPRPSGAQGPCPLQEGRGLRREGWPGGDRGRVHRAHDARTALVGWLHQAVEAKEGVKIESENQTLATITLQNYFRMYDKLAGMTGTAATESEEFAKIYELDVTVVPTNRALIRVNHPGRGLQDRAREVRGASSEIAELHAKGPAGAGGHGVHRELRAPLQAAQEARASRIRCSTPSTTSARRRSWPRPAARRPSPSPPTWPGAAPTSCSGGNPDFLTNELIREEGLDPATGAARRPGRRAWMEAAQGHRAGARAGGGARRPAHPGHRAPRVAPHRQPAARPLRPAGRPGLLALLPLARGRPAPHLRLRAHPAHHGAARHGGGRAHRAHAW